MSRTIVAHKIGCARLLGGECDCGEFAARVQKRRISRMERIDSLPPELRRVVNDYGFMIVDAFMAQGISKPNIIRHLVERVLDEFSPTRGSVSAQGPGAAKARKLTKDWAEAHPEMGDA